MNLEPSFPTNKYPLSEIPRARQKMPHFLSKSDDGKLIMRRDENGDFTLLAHDQKTVVEIPGHYARDFALWVLLYRNNT